MAQIRLDPEYDVFFVKILLRKLVQKWSTRWLDQWAQLVVETDRLGDGLVFSIFGIISIITWIFCQVF